MKVCQHHTLMAHHKVGESVKDVKGKSCDEVEEEPGAEVVHLVGKVHKSDQQIKPIQNYFWRKFPKT